MAKMVDAVEVVASTVSVPASTSSQTVTVNAPTGKKVLSGGAQASGNVGVRYSYPASDASSWTVEVFNNSGSAENVTVSAICLG